MARSCCCTPQLSSRRRVMRNVTSSRPARLIEVRTAAHALPVNSRPGRSTIVSSATTRLRQPDGHGFLRRVARAEEAGDEARALGHRDELRDRLARGSRRARADRRARSPRRRASGRRRCRPTCARSCCRPTWSSTTACPRRGRAAASLTSSTVGSAPTPIVAFRRARNAPPHRDQVDQEQRATSPTARSRRSGRRSPPRPSPPGRTAGPRRGRPSGR